MKTKLFSLMFAIVANVGTLWAVATKPTTAPPTPVHDVNQIKALYCNKYTTNNLYFDVQKWGNTEWTVLSLNGTSICYTQALYWDLLASPNFESYDLSAYDSIHFDVWVPQSSQIQLTIEGNNGGNGGFKGGVVFNLKEGWNTIDASTNNWKDYDWKDFKYYFKYLIIEGYKSNDGTISLEDKPFAFANIYLFAAKNSGSCGENLTWILDNSGTLTISGYGDMYNFYNWQPWESYLVLIKKVVIESGVTNIGDLAFRGCINLTSVTIPNSVTSIGYEAFDGCSNLVSVTLNSNSIVSKTYTSSSNIGTIFGSQVTEYIIGNSVTSIGNSAFSGCSGLTSVTIGNSVTSIGDYAFYGCSGLTSVTIGNSVTSIGKSAFYRCSGLSSPLYNAHVFAFMPTSYSGSYTIPNGIESIAGSAFSQCHGLTSVTIPNSVTSIGDYAFYGCSGLSSPLYNAHVFAFMPTSYSGSYTIPNGIESIAGGAFDDCSGLTSVTIPNSVTSIGDGAFEGCSGLTSITIPNNVTNIGDWAFYRCSGLTSVTFNNSVTSIGLQPFSDCSSLTSIEFGTSVKTTYSSIFSGCTSINSITCHSQRPPTVNGGAFTGVSYSTVVYVPAGSLNTYKMHDVWGLYDVVALASIVTCTVDDETHGSVIGSGTYENGTEVTITAIPNEHWHFLKWSDGNTDNPRVVTAEGDMTFTAIFEANKYAVNYVVDGEPYQTDSVTWGTAIPTLTPQKEGYTFGGWTDLPETMPTHDITVHGVFLKNYTIVVNADNAGHGSVTGGGSYPEGTEITLTAVSQYGWHFTRWSDGITDNPRTVKVSGDADYTAFFEVDRNGTCGENNSLKWIYTQETGVLIISGNGALTSNYTYGIEAPKTMKVLIVEEGVTAIGNSAFYGMTLEEVVIPYTLASMGQNAFGGCTNLKKVVWNARNCEDFASYRYAPFYDSRTQIEKFDLGREIEHIPAYLCYGMICFRSLDLSNTVNSIGIGAFSGCTELENVHLGYGLRSVGAEAFSGCKRITDITSMAERVPDATSTTFNEVSRKAYVYVPAERLRNYEIDAVWGQFLLKAISAENSTVPNNDVSVVPHSNTVDVTWPIVENAASYELVIKDSDGNTICTLVFDSNGQLTTIRFAPGREGNRHNAAAEVLATGFRFTVTGLTEDKQYDLNLDAKDEKDAIIQTFTASFQTGETTGVDDLFAEQTLEEVLANPETKIYTLQGVEVSCDAVMRHAASGLLQTYIFVLGSKTGKAVVGL